MFVDFRMSGSRTLCSAETSVNLDHVLRAGLAEQLSPSADAHDDHSHCLGGAARSEVMADNTVRMKRRVRKGSGNWVGLGVTEYRHPKGSA